MEALRRVTEAMPLRKIVRRIEVGMSLSSEMQHSAFGSVYCTVQRRSVRTCGDLPIKIQCRCVRAYRYLQRGT